MNFTERVYGILREMLDHLAPDDEVERAIGIREWIALDVKARTAERVVLTVLRTVEFVGHVRPAIRCVRGKRHVVVSQPLEEKRDVEWGASDLECAATGCGLRDKGEYLAPQR